MTKPLVIAVTGASGAIYAVRLVQQLVLAEIPCHLVVSPSGNEVFRQELGIDFGLNRKNIRSLLSYALPCDERISLKTVFGESSSAERYRRWVGLDATAVSRAEESIIVHSYNDFLAPIASGSFLTRGMVICPCSGSTLAGIAHAMSGNLIVRAADVHLKEKRRLVLVPRETPLSTLQLENMVRVSSHGATVMPAMPGWYHGVSSLLDLVDFMVARVLDQFEIEHQLMTRWGSDKEENSRLQMPRDGNNEEQRC